MHQYSGWWVFGFPLPVFECVHVSATLCYIQHNANQLREITANKLEMFHVSQDWILTETMLLKVKLCDEQANGWEAVKETCLQSKPVKLIKPLCCLYLRGGESFITSFASHDKIIQDIYHVNISDIKAGWRCFYNLGKSCLPVCQMVMMHDAYNLLARFVWINADRDHYKGPLILFGIQCNNRHTLWGTTPEFDRREQYASHARYIPKKRSICLIKLVWLIVASSSSSSSSSSLAKEKQIQPLHQRC